MLACIKQKAPRFPPIKLSLSSLLRHLNVTGGNDAGNVGSAASAAGSSHSQRLEGVRAPQVYECLEGNISDP